MPLRNVAQMVAQVNRNLGDFNPPLYDIQNELDTANLYLHGMYDWPWTWGESKINIQPSYTTGTVSATDQTATITGSGTTWLTAWSFNSGTTYQSYKRIQFSGNNVDYVIQQFTGATTLTLAQTLNLGANVAAGTSYTIYQDTYPMPADYEPGQDIFMANPQLRMGIQKIPRLHLEQQEVSLRQFFNNVQTGFADSGIDILGNYTIRFIPQPAFNGEYIVYYRRRPPNLNSLAQIPWVPDTFADVLEKMAELELRRQNGMKGLEELERQISAKLAAMRVRISRSSTVIQPVRGTSQGPSSITWNGLSILPWTSPIVQ